MDSPSGTTTDHMPLQHLVTNTLSELKRLGYRRKSLWRYRTVCNRLIAFAEENDMEDSYSDQLAKRFVDAWGPYNGQSTAPSRDLDRCIPFIVTVLGDFSRSGRIERTRTDLRDVSIPPAMKKPLRDYEAYCRDRLHLRQSSIAERIRSLKIFVDFLHARNVRRPEQLRRTDLTDFVASRQRFRPKTVSGNVSSVRLFLRFLVMRGVLQNDLSHVLPTIRVPQNSDIPSVWHPDLVVRLLEVIDRSSPIGKRDYAILLLAYRLGLRVSDIHTLTLDEINWQSATIDFTQCKNQTPLSLPLPEEVGEALIDYLKFGRPKTRHREVFLRLKRPFRPFRSKTHLYGIMTHWRQVAAIKFRTPQRKGLHSLRHTLATQLLRAETPINVISDILGHATTASTLIYAKADTETLRGAALDTEGLCHDE